MELIEMELIKKLQNTQAVQKQAFSDLEQAIQQRAQINEALQGYRTQGARYRGVSQQNNFNNNRVSGDAGLGSLHQMEGFPEI